MNYLQNIEISVFDKNRWVVSTPQGNHLLVNKHTKDLLGILQLSESKDEALLLFNETFGQNLNLKSFEDLIQNKFGNADLLLTDQHRKFRKESYMSLKIKLFNKNISALLATPFSFLFQPFVFWIVFVLSLVLIAVVGWSDFSLNENLIRPEGLIIYTTILYLTMLVHEIGHVASCRKFGVAHGEIGFGFYSIFPVVYADVTKIWTLNKQKRTIANLGGIFLELVYASIWTATYLITKEMVFLAAAVSILIKTVTELNPFIRYDGYWVLSDLINTPNLLPKANGLVRLAFAQLKQFKYTEIFRKWGLNHYLLVFYGLVNWVVFITYIVWVLAEKWQEVLNFPLLILHVVKDIFNLTFESLIGLLSWENMIVLGFYVLIIKFSIKNILKLFKRYRFVTKLDLNGLDQGRLM